MIPGWGAAVSLVLSWVDKMIPSRKAAVIDELNALNVKYATALKNGNDTESAVIRKQMKILREKLGFTDGDI
jgi:RecA/RadA recombinase